MAGIKGAKPQNLANPVAGADLAAAATPDLSAMAMPSPQINAPIAAPAPEAPPADPLADFVPDESGAQAGAQANAANPLADFVPDESAAASATPGPSYARELGTRVQESFANTDWQKEQVLTKTYGPENVRPIKDSDGKPTGEFEVRKDGEWKSFNKGFWSTVGDIVGALNPIGSASAAPDSQQQRSAKEALYGLAGAGKAAVSEAVALPFEMAGAAEGATGVGAPAGIGTIAAGRLAGGIAGESASQALAPALGIPNDPKSGLGPELRQVALTGTLRAAFGASADQMASLTGNWAAGRIASRLEKAASQKAAYLGEGTGATPEQVAQGTVGALKQVVDDVDRLFERGIIQGVQGAEGAAILPGQANSAVPEFQKSMQAATATNEGRNFLYRQGQMFAQAFQTITRAADEVSGKALTLLAKNADKDVIQTLDAATKFWGATVGANRKEAIAQAGDQLFGVGHFEETLHKTALASGFKSLEGDVAKADFSQRVRPDAAAVADKLSINESEAQGLINRLMMMSDSVRGKSGRLTMGEMNSFYEQLATKTRDVFSKEASYSHRQVYADMRNSIRDEFTEAMGAPGILGESATASYNVAKQRYGVMKDAAEELSALFNHRSLSAESMSKYLFSKGQDSLDRIATLKPILMAENPGAWQGVVNDWMDTLTRRYSDEARAGSEISGPLNFKGLYNEFNNKPEILEAVFGKDRAQDIIALTRTGARIRNTGGFSDMEEADIGHALNSAVGIIKLHPGIVAKIVSKFGSTPSAEQAMLENLTRGGRERILKRVAQPNRPIVSKLFDNMSAVAAKTVPTIVGQSASQTARTDAQRLAR